MNTITQRQFQVSLDLILMVEHDVVHKILFHRFRERCSSMVADKLSRNYLFYVLHLRKEKIAIFRHTSASLMIGSTESNDANSLNFRLI